MYQRPVILINDDMAEGVYADSGCYTASAYIHLTPEGGRGDYRIQIDGIHDANHEKDTQWLHISFSQPVNYVYSSGTLVEGDGTTTLKIEYHYYQAPVDNIGLGDLIVSSEPGLAITAVSITD